MRPLVGILEDDREGRLAAMLPVLEGLAAEAVAHDDAPGFLAWLEGAWDDVRLLSLDHDLGPTRQTIEGGRFDPGTGMDVVAFLEARAPRFPVIVHSSNPYAVPSMLYRLEAAGWTVQRVAPFGDQWVEGIWARTVAEQLGRAGAAG